MLFALARLDVLEHDVRIDQVERARIEIGKRPQVQEGRVTQAFCLRDRSRQPEHAWGHIDSCDLESSSCERKAEATDTAPELERPPEDRWPSVKFADHGQKLLYIGLARGIEICETLGGEVLRQKALIREHREVRLARTERLPVQIRRVHGSEVYHQGDGLTNLLDRTSTGDTLRRWLVESPACVAARRRHPSDRSAIGSGGIVKRPALFLMLLLVPFTGLAADDVPSLPPCGELRTPPGPADPELASRFPFAFDGIWVGELAGIDAPELYPLCKWDQTLRLKIHGAKSSIEYFNGKTWVTFEEEAVVHVTESNGVITATHFKKERYWVETWTITLTQKSPGTLLAVWTRMVNNHALPVTDVQSKYAFIAAGEFSRMSE